ncbi:hypothetical protein J7H87_004348 [Vibrio parahaemolyticus]|nr:hypothetical protein [Vibrio parahaemolyticus]EHK0063496.1 hypothetical protein [Vibrio parahaemolyticus]
MAKGIKMVRALKLSGNIESNISIKHLSKSDNGSIFCEGEKCRTKIEYTSGYTRQATDTKVLPYLKLAKGASHKEGCKNSTAGSVKVIVSESEDIEGAPNIFEELSAGKFTIRLNFLADTQSRLNEIASKISTEDTNSPALGKEYIETKERLSSYCRSAAGIARLRSLLLERNDIKELASLMKIQFKNTFIKWNEFFYDDERYHVLFNRCNRNAIEHPIAMRITPKYRKDNGGKISYQCSAENSEDISYVPWLNLDEELSNLDLELNKSYIVLANLKVTGSGRYNNLKLNIVNKMQIVAE